MSTFDQSPQFPRDLVLVTAYLKMNKKLHRYLLEESRKRGMLIERYIVAVLEEKRQEAQANGQH